MIPIGRRGPARWRTIAPWLAAAAAVIVAVRVGLPDATDRKAIASAPAPAPATAAATAAESGELRARPARAAARPTYDQSVQELRDLLSQDRDRLSPETIAALEKSLAAIDAAIADAERAVARDTTDPFLSTYLSKTRARKLALLRQAALLVQS